MTGLDWVQVDSGFSSSLAVLCATDLLDMDPRTFTGAMVDLQDWAVRNLPSGRFAPLSLSPGHVPDASTDERLWRKMLERVVRWDGAPGVFWDALIHAGLLVREEDGSVRLTLCDRYVQVLEKRAKDAERKRRERSAGKTPPVSLGRPVDMAGTSVPRKRKDKETEKKTSSAAAREEEGAPGRLIPVPAPSSTAVTDEGPVQRALPGIHLVPASPPSEERLLAAAAALAAPVAEPSRAAPAATTPSERASAFFELFQDERCRAFPGVPREARPAGWNDWYRQALAAIGADDGRLLDACRSYLASDWGRARQPAGTALAFCSPKVWMRYVSPLAPREAPADAVIPAVDTSSEAGRRWRDCLAWLQEDGRRYAVSWLVQARPVDLEDGVLVLEAPNAYVGQWLSDHYGALLERVARALSLAGVRWQHAGEGHPAAVR